MRRRLGVDPAGATPTTGKFNPTLVSAATLTTGLPAEPSQSVQSYIVAVSVSPDWHQFDQLIGVTYAAAMLCGGDTLSLSS